MLVYLFVEKTTPNLRKSKVACEDNSFAFISTLFCIRILTRATHSYFSKILYLNYNIIILKKNILYILHSISHSKT